MVHQYQLNGYNIVLDTCSGSVHVVDEVAYDVIAMYPDHTADEIVAAMMAKYGDREDVTEADLRQCIDDVASLKESGKLWSPDTYENLAFDFKNRNTVVTIKIVQRKKVTVKGWWRKHWVGGHISRYEWVPPYTYTKYKVKVTLKKKVPKIGGMWVASNWVKGSKKSYTVWVPNGAQKGKKLTIRISTALGKGYGNGPEVKKVIRVK